MNSFTLEPCIIKDGGDVSGGPVFVVLVFLGPSLVSLGQHKVDF